jgi:PilZ domain
MKATRSNSRTGSSENCEIDLGGSRYQCRISNISASGARVTCLGFLQEVWPGDRGVLRLNNRTGELPCRVTRIASSTIGLRFAQ